jgi:hypothetical protein
VQRRRLLARVREQPPAFLPERRADQRHARGIAAWSVETSEVARMKLRPRLRENLYASYLPPLKIGTVTASQQASEEADAAWKLLIDPCAPCRLRVTCRHSASPTRMSAIPPKADIAEAREHVRFGPLPEVTALLDYMVIHCHKVFIERGCQAAIN